MICLLVVLAVSGAKAATAVFLVRNTNDAGFGSLRQAILDANAHANGSAPDEIHFAISGSGTHTAVVQTALPEITEPVIIDGWTQPGWNGVPRIELTGDPAATMDGLTITGGGTTIRGLVMNGFKAAIRINQNGNNTVKGCYLGTDKTGLQAVPNDSGISGLTVSNTVIGGPAAQDRNLISGNRYAGISFGEFDARSIQSSGNVIQGNYVGTDVTGTVALPNGTAAGGTWTAISVSCNSAKIGGPEPGAGNLVSGNAGPGIALTGSSAVIQANIVGTDISGSVALPNKGTGIFMASLGGILGGTTAATRNLVSGNVGTGIQVQSSDGRIQGNYVGTDKTGKIAIPNSTGMAVSGFRNLIGGDTPGAGNLISGNGGTGLFLFTSFSSIGFGFNPIPPLDTLIQGNLIGTDVTGAAALPNGGGGLVVPSYRSRIGGVTPGTRNVISGNAGNGISVGPGDGGMQIEGNFIGTQMDGTSPLGNSGNGVAIVDSGGCVIGSASGPDADAGNTIGFNLGNGIDVQISEKSPKPQRISANSIHDNALLGINLGADGPNSSDAGDSDYGPNNLQNAPTISAAFGFNGNLTIYGQLNSAPSNAFILEFFANQTADSSGFGEGNILLGQARVTTDGFGTVGFNVTFPLPPNVSAVSATAIDSTGNTSEFSAAANISSTAPTSPPVGPTKVFPATHSVHLLNISTRLRVEPGDHALIAGLVVSGTEPKKVIVRGIGPSLDGSGVPGTLENPILELHDSAGQLLKSNDDWRSDQESEIETSGVAPASERESAIVATLAPGSYTAVLRGKSDSSGVGLVDAYDLSQGTRSHLANVSTRGFVSTGDNVIIGGFIVGDNGGGTKVVVRALGPSLTASGIQDALSDPYLELHNPDGTLLDFNDNWMSALGSDEIRAAHLEPKDDRESAIFRNLAPGNYTAIVRGEPSETVGVAVVEVYDLGPQ